MSESAWLGRPGWGVQLDAQSRREIHPPPLRSDQRPPAQELGGWVPISHAFDLHASVVPTTLTGMDHPDEALSAEDRYVLEMLDKAHEQYETYLSIRAAADMSILRELADRAKQEPVKSDIGFKPQPLTITFDSSG